MVCIGGKQPCQGAELEKTCKRAAWKAAFSGGRGAAGRRGAHLTGLAPGAEALGLGTHFGGLDSNPYKWHQHIIPYSADL